MYIGGKEGGNAVVHVGGRMDGRRKGGREEGGMEEGRGGREGMSQSILRLS